MTKYSKPCPICKKPRSEEHAPFCSTRCKDRDLARWFGDGYSVPGDPVSPDDIASSAGGNERDWQE